MSKERARRREAREREAAIRAAARAAEEERRERRTARTAAVRRATTDRLPRWGLPRRTGRPTGPLARRRRIRTSLLVVALVAVNVLVWVVRPDWASRLAALVLTLLFAPVLAGLLVRRR